MWDELQKAEQAAKESGIMKIFGYVAAAVITIITAGTMSALAALLVVAVTVVDELGYLEQGVDALVTATGTSDDSTAGKFLSAGLKILVTVILCAMTAGAAGIEEGSEQGATMATKEAAESTATTVADDSSVAATGVANDAKKAEKAAKDIQSAKQWFAGKMQFTNLFGTLNPLGDLAIGIKRASSGGKDDDTENWISMGTMIASTIIGMGLMYNAMNGLEKCANGGFLTKVFDDSKMLSAVLRNLTRLSSLLNMVGAGLQMHVGYLTYQKGEIENQMAPIIGGTTQFDQMSAMCQADMQNNQSWIKDNGDNNEELGKTFQYDEFSNFAKVQMQV
jgi:hypothetical protein